MLSEHGIFLCPHCRVQSEDGSMNRSTLETTVALGAVTGIRSMAGLAGLMWARGGAARALTMAAATGEMIADKTSLVGNRTDALPLTGRVILGAVVGVLVAREQHEDAVVGGVLGAATALAATHLAFQARTRLPLSNVAGGLLEDVLVVTIASRYV